VDDEPLARERIRNLLESEPDVEVAAECADGKEAVEAIRRHRPDLLFLDVQMPRLDGFGVLRELEQERLPLTIFVTAFDRHAVKAFEVHALDYLLKPFDASRFQKAVAHARGQLERQRAGSINQRLSALLADVESPGKNKPLERVMIKSGGRIFFLRLEQIDWIEAAGNYVRLHVGEDVHLLRETMNGLEAKLDARQFLRIHRSTIVNVERIQELQPLFHGDYVVILRGGKQLTMSRNYREKLQEHFGQAL
jgi:two-component system LytT family response regulator